MNNAIMKNMNVSHPLKAAAIATGIAFGSLGQCFAGSGAAFLKVPVGARSVGMGNAYTATVNDVTALHYNPAGLSRLGRKELSFMHAELFADQRYDFIGYGMPIGMGGREVSEISDAPFMSRDSKARTPFASPWGLGFSAIYLSHGSLEGRDEQGRKTGDFGANDFAFHMGLSRKVTQRSYFGATVKALRESIGSDSASGFAADLGYMARMPRFTLGLSLLNLGPSLKFSSERYSLPLTLATGAGYALGGGLILSADYKHRLSDNVSSLGAGGEFSVMNNFSIRAGYLSQLTNLSKSSSGSRNLADQLTGLGMGFGLRAFKSQIDYALTPMGELGLTQRVSLTTRF